MYKFMNNTETPTKLKNNRTKSVEADESVRLRSGIIIPMATIKINKSICDAVKIWFRSRIFNLVHWMRAVGNGKLFSPNIRVNFDIKLKDSKNGSVVDIVRKFTSNFLIELWIILYNYTLLVKWIWLYVFGDSCLCGSIYTTELLKYSWILHVKTINWTDTITWIKCLLTKQFTWNSTAIDLIWMIKTNDPRFIFDKFRPIKLENVQRWDLDLFFPYSDHRFWLLSAITHNCPSNSYTVQYFFMVTLGVTRFHVMGMKNA